MTSLFLLQIDYGRESGTDWTIAECNRAALIEDFISGQFDRVLRVIEVETSEGWNRDVSLSLAEDIAAKRVHLPDAVIGFIHRHHPALGREIDRRAA